MTHLPSNNVIPPSNRVILPSDTVILPSPTVILPSPTVILNGVKDLGLRSRRWRRGFTLIELLVVMAVTAVLLVMLFAPLSRALDLVARGNATAKGQDQVRKAMRQVTSEIGNAMQVYEPRPLEVWGYDAWAASGKVRPANGAIPEAYALPNALFMFRLPKHRYYCTQNQHYVTQDDVDTAYGVGTPIDYVGLGDCPRHPGSPVIFRPTAPLEADNSIIAYFIGLKNPGLRDGANHPVYDNIVLFHQNGPAVYGPNDPKNALNTYALYRVEFDPRAPSGSAFDNGAGFDTRWLPLWDPNPAGYNPAFFYDTTAIGGFPRYRWWDSYHDTTAGPNPVRPPSYAINKVMDIEAADVVRWVQQSTGKYMPQSLCTFGPASVPAETAQPNRGAGQYFLSGSALPPFLPALEYGLDHGQWSGLADDGVTLVPTAMALGPGGATVGPRIQVLEGGLSGAGEFDSLDTSKRNRLVAFDSISGRVLFAVKRRDDTQPTTDLRHLAFSSNIAPAGGDLYAVDLTQDNAVVGGAFPDAGLPSSFGAAAAWTGGGPGRTVLIVPGSEQVSLVQPPFNNNPVVQHLQRGGWTGFGTKYGHPELDHDVTQLQPDEYKIDYATGIITLSDTSPDTTGTSDWANVGIGKNWEIMVSYAFQTNKPGDVVRVSYSTKELAEVKLGIVEYTRSRSEVLPFEVSQKVGVPNTRR